MFFNTFRIHKRISKKYVNIYNYFFEFYSRPKKKKKSVFSYHDKSQTMSCAQMEPIQIVRDLSLCTKQIKKKNTTK